jgi:hypothetical protein
MSCTPWSSQPATLRHLVLFKSFCGAVGNGGWRHLLLSANLCVVESEMVKTVLLNSAICDGLFGSVLMFFINDSASTYIWGRSSSGYLFFNRSSGYLNRASIVERLVFFLIRKGYGVFIGSPARYLKMSGQVCPPWDWSIFFLCTETLWCTVQVRSNCRFKPQVSVYIFYWSAFVHLFIIICCLVSLFSTG